MKVVIEFNSWEEADELDAALNGSKYKDKLDEIWNQLFRPSHKHGYGNARINEILACNDDGTPKHPEVHELLDFLEAQYREVVHEV
jgi:hypothetical protein